jgi:hypothetical protein
MHLTLLSTFYSLTYFSDQRRVAGVWNKLTAQCLPQTSILESFVNFFIKPSYIDL